jgi:hypothetical protein
MFIFFAISQLTLSVQCFFGIDQTFKNSNKSLKSSWSIIGKPLFKRLKMEENWMFPFHSLIKVKLLENKFY